MRGFIFCVDLSLQIAMIGTLVFLMNALSAPTPPRSPADIPSTSSIIITDFLLTPNPESSFWENRRFKQSVIRSDDCMEASTHLILTSRFEESRQSSIGNLTRESSLSSSKQYTSASPSPACSVLVKRERGKKRGQREFRGENKLTSNNFLLLVSLAFNSRIS